MIDPTELTSLLKNVQKPAQYLGNEVNVIRKDFAKQRVRVCLVFPDAYEMGMSYMGQKILYEILNNIEGVVAERCFAPLPDFEKKLREKNLPLFSLESKIPLREFDIIAISVPYELTYTNLLNILDLGGIPVWQKDRKNFDPFVITGGTSAYNPEPYADFVDAVGIGDGEEMIVEIVSRFLEWKEKQNPREEFLHMLTQIQGVYVPKFFEPIYNNDGTLKEVKPLKDGYTGVAKRIVQDLDKQPYPTKLVVPNIKLIHDRIGIEIQRGCTRMCRFCQAGYVERPTRQRSPEKVLEIADKSYEQTGIDEISLLSLSAGDYQTIVPTLKELNRRYAHKKVSISVPATRTETLTPELIEQVKQVRKTGFTIAPEAGSERMRRIINKGNKVENLMQACHNAFSAGYELIKFYYLCGLPFEHDEDLIGMANEAHQALEIGWSYTKRAHLNVSVSSLVPKPFTPFQWTSQLPQTENERRLHLVKTNLRDKRLKFKCHDSSMSLIEGLFSRGDRRLSRVLYEAFRNGCRFDEWGEHFRFDLWQKTFSETKTDLDFYVHRERKKEEILPWDHLFVQMKKDWLWKEFEAAREAAFVADCSIGKCAEFCGVCDFQKIKNRIYVIDDKDTKKGNREWYGRFGGSRHCDPELVEGGGAIQTLDRPRRGPWPSGLYGHVSFQPPRDDDQHSLKLERTHAHEIKFKLRVHFSKCGLAALMGHLELMDHLKRAILRTGVLADYTQGFHPQMKLSMGYALPLGVESLCEGFDLVMKQNVDFETFPKNLQKALAQGLTVLRVESIPLEAPSLSAQTKEIFYEVTYPEDFAEDLHQGIEAFVKGSAFVYTRQTRNGKRDFQINDLVKIQGDVQKDQTRFCFSTRIEKEGSLKPLEVFSALSGIFLDRLQEIQVRKIGVSYYGE